MSGSVRISTVAQHGGKIIEGQFLRRIPPGFQKLIYRGRQFFDVIGFQQVIEQVGECLNQELLSFKLWRDIIGEPQRIKRMRIPEKIITVGVVDQCVTERSASVCVSL